MKWTYYLDKMHVSSR